MLLLGVDEAEPGRVCGPKDHVSPHVAAHKVGREVEGEEDHERGVTGGARKSVKEARGLVDVVRLRRKRSVCVCEAR